MTDTTDKTDKSLTRRSFKKGTTLNQPLSILESESVKKVIRDIIEDGRKLDIKENFVQGNGLPHEVIHVDFVNKTIIAKM